MQEIYRCCKCGVFFEHPTLYVIENNIIQPKGEGLCFQHLQDKELRKRAKSEREKFVRQKYEKLYPEYKEADSKTNMLRLINRKNTGISLENALTNFAFEKNNGEAGIIIIGDDLDKEKLNNNTINIKLQDIKISLNIENIKNRFDKIFFARTVGDYSLLTILTETKNPQELTRLSNDVIEYIKSFLEEKEKTLAMPYCANISCHKKRDEDIITLIEERFKNASESSVARGKVRYASGWL
ncbi:MAG: hypothetical protein QXG86_01210 [Candidatus Woesearchaeota archaeon]